MPITALNVFLLSLLTALATGLGALPFFFIKNISGRLLGLFSALAAGLMLGASVDLIVEGASRNISGTVAGLVGGMLLIVAAQRLLKKTEHSGPEAFLKPNFRKMLLVVAVMTVHSFAEGVSMGFSFKATAAFGMLIVVAMAIQNIPEGLAISLALCGKGLSPWKAAGWSIFSSLPQPIMALPAFIFISAFQGWLPAGLGFSAGAMLWLIFGELIPEAKEQMSTGVWLPIIGGSVFLMLAMDIAFR